MTISNTLFIGKVLYYIDKVDSTNIFLQELLKNDKISDGTLVYAGHQTAGKGQRGNSWLDEANSNLSMSIFLKCHFLRMDHQFFLSMAISLGIVDFLDKIENLPASIKWPNDIYLENKKAGGILIENNSLGSYINESIIGIGLNVNQLKFDENIPNPTSLALHSNKKYKIEDLVQELTSFIEKRFLQLKNGKLGELKSDYHSKLYRYKKEAFYIIDGKYQEGIILGVDDYGKLMLDLKGEIKFFDIKEIVFAW